MHNNLVPLLVLTSLLAVPLSFAFQPVLLGSVRVVRGNIHPATSATTLFYQSNATDHDSSSSRTGGHPRQSPSTPTIPVIGPLLNQPPLLMGATLWLDPPTPLQWKTIEVCVDAMVAQQQQGQDDGDWLATIDAAPLVAILQEGSELASIAAIVGYQQSSSFTDRPSQLDAFDSASLRESLAGLSSTPFYKDSTKVRLLCIGRAKISDLTAKEYGCGSSSAASRTGNEGGSNDHAMHDEYDDDDDDESQQHLTASSTSTTSEPILMAQMQLVLDTSVSRGARDSNGEFGSNSSPVHALSQLSMWAARIGFLHKDRQKLVQGIQAAQMRLEMLSSEWRDWDGLGSLYNDDANGTGDARFDPNAEFQSKIDDMLRMTEDESPPPSSSTTNNQVPLTSAKILSPGAARLLELDNFGLGSSPTAYCDLHSMTQVLMELLQSYYSPDRVQTEEFEYSLYSWVALQSMMAFLKGHGDLKRSLEATNTIDRMDMVYQSMLSHKGALRELALAKSQELRDCGEECELF